jgi:hypothetical protein
MANTTRHLVQVALVAAMLAGCTTTGTIGGRVAGPDKPAAAVAFTSTASQGRHHGTLSTALPSGEGFSSQYVHITSTSAVDTSDPLFLGSRLGSLASIEYPMGSTAAMAQRP